MGYNMNNRRNRSNQFQELLRKWETCKTGCARSVMSGFFALLMVFPASVLARGNWGWRAHEYISFHAVQYLPSEMSFFLYQRTFLYQHASDPDRDGSPGYYHYIDIDYYQEFYDGTLPHEWEEMLELYDESEVREVGIVPWVIQWWTDSLSVLMSRNQWDNAWQIAANLGHYVADSHQPLHLTLNYDGQYSGNDGIHSRYETQLIGPHLGLLPLPEGEAVYWDSVIDSVFGYISEVYPNVTWVLLADNLARSQDPSYGTTYYNVMWTELESISTDVIQSAILDLASIWYTAWVNAREPIPALGTEEILDDDLTQSYYALYPNYPNPFNATTVIRYDIPKSSSVPSNGFSLALPTASPEGIHSDKHRFIQFQITIEGLHTLLVQGHDHPTAAVEPIQGRAAGNYVKTEPIHRNTQTEIIQELTLGGLTDPETLPDGSARVPITTLTTPPKAGPAPMKTTFRICVLHQPNLPLQVRSGWQLPSLRLYPKQFRISLSYFDL